MRISIWDVFSVFAILLTVGVGLIAGLIFLNPEANFNPLPPPTVPASLFIPSPTATFQHMPVTWTAGAQQAVQLTLRPSSTPLLQQTAPILNTQTPLPTFTNTPTNTPTPTATKVPTLTPTKTKTPTVTPNLTATKLSQISTNAAATQTAAANQTLTATYMPPNPSSATETTDPPAEDDTWQNTISDPAFTWDPAINAESYYVYWGPSDSGTSTDTTPTASYNTDAVDTTGTYYLRVRTKFVGGAEHPDWSTIFTFRYDNIVPSNPSSAIETIGATHDTWQNTISDPAFTWSGASDSPSGISHYDVYWGDDHDGTSVKESPVSAAHDPTAVTSGTFYLRVRTIDNAGNKSAWTNLFTFKYDITPPSDPINLVSTPTSPSNNSTPQFNWDVSTDDHSELAGYEIYWALASEDSCLAAAPNQDDEADASFTPAEPLTGGDADYRLCVRAKDNAGNTSDWLEAVFEYRP